MVLYRSPECIGYAELEQRPMGLIQHFRLSVAMATNQNEEFVQHFYACWRIMQQTFRKINLSKYLQ